MSADQFLHLIKQAAAQGGDVTPFRYGHIASYDPLLHRCRCIIPSMTDQDGAPLLSPWMPMGTLSGGAGYGVQMIYAGGATVDNPTAGEQVLIAVFDRQRGVSAVPCMFFHGTAQPPATNLPTTQDGFSGNASAAVPGDLIIAAPPATQGAANTFIRLRQSGVIEIWAAGAVNADVQGPINVTAQGTNNIAITATNGNITVQAMTGVVNVLGAAVRLGKAAADTLYQQLCNTNFWANFNAHTHSVGGPPPVQLATEATLTQTTTAE